MERNIKMEKSLNKKTPRFCAICNNDIGYYESKTKTLNKIRKVEYFSQVPFLLNNRKYYRKICVDCFLKTYGRMPTAPNIPNEDYIPLLGLPIDEFKIMLKSHRDGRKMTLKNCIKKYGEEEGLKRWNLYCKKQSITNTYEYKKEKFGWSLSEFDEYNKKRAVTLENFIERHGETTGRKKWESYCNRQKYAGVTIEYYKEKYGEEEGLKRWDELIKLKSLNNKLEGYIKKYGEEEGLKRWDEHIEKMKSSFLHYSRSKISDKVIGDLKLLLNKKYQFDNHNMVEEYNFNIEEEENESRDYFVDLFIKDKQIAIEFYGDYWHANPVIYPAEFLISYPNNTKKLSNEIWEKDNDRIEKIKRSNNKISFIILWEFDILVAQGNGTYNNIINEIAERIINHNE